MQLSLTRFFRPKWQHPRAEVRRQAVERLDPETPEDGDILATLAQADGDPGVRLEALERLVDPQLVAKLAGQSAVAEVRSRARARLLELLMTAESLALDPVQLLPFLEVLDEDEHLRLVLEGDSYALRQEAVLRLAEESSLEQVLSGQQDRRLSLMAAEGIREPRRLQRLIRDWRSRDKPIYRQLKNQLNTQREQERRERQHREHQAQLCAGLEKLAESAVSLHYRTRLEDLERRWAQLDLEPDPVAAQRFATASRQCRLKAERYEEELAERHRQQELQSALEQTFSAHQAFCEALLEPATGRDPGALEQHRQLQQQWRNLCAEESPEAARQHEWEALEEVAARRLAAWHRLAGLETTLETADEAKALDTLITELDWPPEMASPEALKAALERLQRARQPVSAKSAAKPRSDGREALSQLEEALDEGRLQAARELLSPLRQQQARLPAGQQRQLQQLGGRYQELRDWQDFATRPKLEALCEAMEALAAEDSLPSGIKAERLQRLQQQWKEINSPQVPRPLRQRFQTANDRTYEACREFFAQQRARRKEHARQRRELLAELETRLAGIDWDNAELSPLLAFNRSIRSRWRQIPLGPGASRPYQGRFKRSLKQLEKGLDSIRQRNGARREALLAEAQALMDDTLPGAQARTIQPLTTQPLTTMESIEAAWKATGPGFRDQDTRLEAAFAQLRADCQQRCRRDRDQRCREEENAVQHLCRRLEAASAPLDTSLKLLRQQGTSALQKLAPLVSRKHHERLESALEEALISYQLKFHPEDADWASLQGFDRECRVLEGGWLDNGHSTALDTRPARTVLEQIGSKAVRTLAGQRLECLHGLEADEASLAALDRDTRKALRLLCIRAEILRGLSSPEEDQALRLEHQMSRLQQALNQGAAKDTCRELMALQQEWLCTPFQSRYPDLAERFDRLLPSSARDWRQS